MNQSFCCCCFKPGIITLRSCWKRDADGVASGPTVSPCAAEPLGLRLAMFGITQVQCGRSRVVGLCRYKALGLVWARCFLWLSGLVRQSLHWPLWNNHNTNFTGFFCGNHKIFVVHLAFYLVLYTVNILLLIYHDKFFSNAVSVWIKHV